MLDHFSRLFVRWVHEGVLWKFGPASEINETTIEHFFRCLESGFECDKEVFLVAAVYLFRLHDCCDRDINARNAILASVSLAYKFLNDLRPDMKIHAYSGGVTVSDLVALENALLGALSFKLFVTIEQFQQMKFKVDCEAINSSHQMDICPYEAVLLTQAHTLSFAEPPAAIVTVIKHAPQVSQVGWSSMPTYVPNLPYSQSCPVVVPTPVAAESDCPDWMSLINPSCVDFSSWSHAVFPG
jgi:hypothetical protein